MSSLFRVLGWTLDMTCSRAVVVVAVIVVLVTFANGPRSLANERCAQLNDLRSESLAECIRRSNEEIEILKVERDALKSNVSELRSNRETLKSNISVLESDIRILKAETCMLAYAAKVAPPAHCKSPAR